jgi:hypothetical protein
MRGRTRLRFAIFWIALILAAGIAGNVYYALRPSAIHAQIRQALTAMLAVPFEFSSCELSWSHGAIVRDLRVFSPEQSGSSTEARPDFFRATWVSVLPRWLPLLRGRFEMGRIIVDSPRIRVVRNGEGRWNFEDVWVPTALGDGEGLWEWLEKLPVVLIEKGSVQYTDEYTFPAPVSETLDEVDARVTRGAGEDLELKALLRTRFASKLKVACSVNFSGREPELRVQVAAKKIDLSIPVTQYFPGGVAEEARRLKVRGFIDEVDGEFKYSTKDGLVPIEIVGNILRGEFFPPYCPFPVKGLRGSFRVTERMAAFTDLQGGLGSGEIAVTAAEVALTEPWFFSGKRPRLASWKLFGSMKGFTVDRRLGKVVPPELRRVLHKYGVDGTIGVDIKVPDSRTFPPHPEDISATVYLEGVDVVLDDFPYPVRDLRGELLIDEGRVKFAQPVVGRGGPTRVAVSGWGAELSPNGKIEMTIKAEGLPLTEKLRRALPARVWDVWDDFRLEGAVDCVIDIVRARSAATPRATVAMFPQDVRMSYRHFPYEIDGISGTVFLDTGTNTLTFRDLQGRHGEQVIEGAGAVELDSLVHGGRPRYKMTIHSDSLNVDQDLVAALSENGRNLLKEFNFEGRVRADVTIQSDEKGEAEVKSEMSLLGGSIKYDVFPYTLELERGHMELSGDAAFSMTDVSTPVEAKPSVVFSGGLTTKGSERALEFQFNIKDLQFDDKLVSALPDRLATLVTSMQLGGTYSGRIAGSYSFDENDPEHYTVIYRGEDIVADEASVDFGLYIHEIVAKGSFVGGASSTRPHYLAGELFVESARFNRLRLTDGEVDFVLGSDHPAIKLVRDDPAIKERDYLPPANMLERLTSEQVEDAFQMRVHSSDLYGGAVDGFLYIDMGERNDFGGHFIGKDLYVAEAAEDVFGARGAETGGMASGEIEFSGALDGGESIRGQGSGLIEKAHLIELPLFLGILSTLFGENSDRHYFTQVRLEYDIKDNKFVASKGGGIEIVSPGLKLFGGGTMDFLGNLDLTLEPRLLNFRIPIVEQLFSLIKKGVAQVFLTGNLTNPRTKFATAGGLIRIGIDTPEEPGAPLSLDLRKSETVKSSGDVEEEDLPPGVDE